MCGKLHSLRQGPHCATWFATHAGLTDDFHVKSDAKVNAPSTWQSCAADFES
jgi:hypothetical protein